MITRKVLNQCKAILQKQYGSRFKGLILYGSEARKQAQPTSDIDLLVLLDSPIDYFVELRRIVDVLYPIQLESDRLISAKPAPLEDYEKGRFQLYREARRDGLLV